jgi:hypothetical protein
MTRTEIATKTAQAYAIDKAHSEATLELVPERRIRNLRRV